MAQRNNSFVAKPNFIELPGRLGQRGHSTLAVIHAVAQLWVVRWYMRILGFFVLLVLAFRLPAADSPAPMMDGAWSIGSEWTNPNSVDFMSRITRDQLVRTPAWDNGSEFPPLSPRKAEDQARAMLKKILGERRWTEADIDLKPFDVTADDGNHRVVRWLYVLHFGLVNDVDNNAGGAFNIIVLMDGTAIEPKLVVPKPAVVKPAVTNALPTKPAVPAKPATP